MERLAGRIQKWDLRKIASFAATVLGGAGGLGLYLASGGTLPVATAAVALSAAFTLLTGKQLDVSPEVIRLPLPCIQRALGVNRGLAILA